MNTKERIAFLDGTIASIEKEMADDLEVFQARQKNKKALLKQYREEQVQLCRDRMAELDALEKQL